ncbi:unnamed protein product [Lasius platythorax]|uniref:Uncharacterized protein n=1 Tax=Lasius platythorax TaxID=488582 RepID=A0AAV2MZ60_9HYME
MEAVNKIRAARKERRMMLDILWGETPWARELADLFNVAEEDTFNLNGLFEEDLKQKYVKEWLERHEGWWGFRPERTYGWRPMV